MQMDNVVKAMDFWQGKEPCWEMRACPGSIRQECPAPRHKEYPCWEIEGTYCKWDDWGALGRDIMVCKICSVYLRYGAGCSIEIKLTDYTHDDLPVP